VRDRPVSSVAARRERLQDVAAETPVVERVLPEAFWGFAPPSVAHHLRVMEVVERNSDDGTVESTYGRGQFVG
jgi:hypothetical protein